MYSGNLFAFSAGVTPRPTINKVVYIILFVGADTRLQGNLGVERSETLNRPFDFARTLSGDS